MKHYRIFCTILSIVLFCLPSVLKAESDSLMWDFSDIFQGTKANPTLPSSLEGWKEHTTPVTLLVTRSTSRHTSVEATQASSRT